MKYQSLPINVGNYRPFNLIHVNCMKTCSWSNLELKLVKCCRRWSSIITTLCQHSPHLCILNNTMYLPNAGSMLVHRLRRWPNIEPALGRRLVFAVYTPWLNVPTCHIKQLRSEVNPSLIHWPKTTGVYNSVGISANTTRWFKLVWCWTSIADGSTWDNFEIILLNLFIALLPIVHIHQVKLENLISF